MSSPILFKAKQAATLAQFCEQCLALDSARPDDEFYYHSLTLCVIDAVYSIGVRYEGVQNVVRRYCDYFGLRQNGRLPNCLPPQSEQQSISELIAKMEEFGIEKFTNAIFQNKQRTSTSGGILKSEAVLRFAQVLRDYNVNFLQDVSRVVADENLNTALRGIPGQASGISVRYFFMLAGAQDLIKPDRWILRFLERCLGTIPEVEDAQSLISDATKILKARYGHLTPMLLDNLIWNHERRQSKAASMHA